jgi:hypothetical protein
MASSSPCSPAGTKLAFLSTTPTFLSTQLAFLSTTPTFLSTQLPFLSTQPTFLSTELTFLSTEPTILSTQELTFLRCLDITNYRCILHYHARISGCFFFVGVIIVSFFSYALSTPEKFAAFLGQGLMTSGLFGGLAVRDPWYSR